MGTLNRKGEVYVHGFIPSQIITLSIVGPNMPVVTNHINAPFVGDIFCFMNARVIKSSVRIRLCFQKRLTVTTTTAIKTKAIVTLRKFTLIIYQQYELL